LLLILKSQYMQHSLQYLGKYAFIQRETRRFWKDLRQTNPYVSNKWPLKFPCAYLNTQGSGTTGTPLIRIQGNIFTIIRRYSFTLRTLVQYFVVLGNSIFLHFRPISNKLKKVVSLQFQMGIKSSIY
ncbi:hypothetical protein T06_15406, partial [Trichinella sp. T6]